MSFLQSQIVEVCVFRRENDVLQYLVLQRSNTEKLYPGIWQVVTGSIQEHETALQAAVREFTEETGLPVKKMWSVPVIDSYFDIQTDTVQMAPVFAVETNAGAHVQLSHEHTLHAWQSYEEAGQVLVWPGQRRILVMVHEYIAGKKEAGKLLEVKPSLFERNKP